VFKGKLVKSEQQEHTPATKLHWRFCIIIIASASLCWKTVGSLILYSLHNEPGSHIILIPFMSAFFLFTERKRIFATVEPSQIFGIIVILFGSSLYWTTAVSGRWQGNESLSAATIPLVFVWIAGFLYSYGLSAGRRAMFPLALLLLMIPWPDRLVDRVVVFLQMRSTELSYAFFRVLGVPTLRQGFFLTVPGVTIQVAKECSGIHSSIALFITSLLAAQLFLRGPWRKALFVIVGFPLAIVKNAIRIVSLTLLAVRVDPSFLTGRLHHQGGIVFFLLALALLAPFLQLLRRPTTTSEDVPIVGTT
jgi:exosortase